MVSKINTFWGGLEKTLQEARSKTVVAFLWTFLLQFQKQKDHHLGLGEHRARFKLPNARLPPPNDSDEI